MAVCVANPVEAAPVSPKIQALTQSKNYGVHMNWTTVAGAKYYEVYRNGELVDLVDDLKYTENRSSVVELSTYLYRVKACNASGQCSKPSAHKILIYTADHGKLTSPVSNDLDFSGKVPKNVYLSSSAGAVFLRWTPHPDAVKTHVHLNGVHVATRLKNNPIYQIISRNQGDRYHLISVFRNGKKSGKSVSIAGPVK